MSRIAKILEGIDQCCGGKPDTGYWETSVGAEYGRDILDQCMAYETELVSALEGVLSVADRATIEFDAVRAAIKKAKGE